MKIIVGSSALQYFGLARQPPKDKDVWISYGEIVQKGVGVDVKSIPSEILNLITAKDGFATPDSCYTIKCSHLGWNNPMWDKHKQDVLWLKHKGCKIIPELYNALVEYWKTKLGDKSFLSLKQDKDSFFTDEVPYVIDHDVLHEMVAYPNHPVYTKCLKSGEDVLIDKQKFDKLDFEYQVRMFREEITVIAIERWIVNPKVKGKYSWMQAYMFSLKKTITQLTKNWATDFIVLNLEYFVKPDFTYFKHTLENLEKEKYL